MGERISLREYARRRDCTLGAVQKAIKSGRITLFDGKIDPEVADIQWQRNTDRAQQQRAQGLKPSAPVGASYQHGESEPAATTGYANNVRDRVETARAQIFELELAERRGDLVKASEVKKIAYEKARIARDALMGIPARLSSVLAAESDAKKCHDILSVEIRKVCQELAAGEPADTQ